MKEKSKIWDRKLFVEGLRRTKWIGISALILFGIFLLMKGIDIGTRGQYLVAGDAYVMGVNSLSLYGAEALQMLICYIFVPIMMLKLFAFTNKRVSSDFYHAVPKKRLTFYITFCGVVFAWAIVLSVFFAASDTLMSGLVEKLTIFNDQPIIIDDATTYDYSSISIKASNLEIDWLEMSHQCLYVLAGSVLSMGALSVGMAMTGTTLTNIVATLVIVIVPRMLLSQFVHTFYSMTPFLPENETVQKVIDSSYQILYSGLFHSIDMEYSYSEGESVLLQWIPIIYSTLLGLLYMLIGGRAFCKRKSEMSGKASVNRICQVFLQVVIAFVCGLPAVKGIVKWIIHEETKDLNVKSVIVWIGISIAVYFIFEFLVARKWKSVIKSARWLPVLFGVYVIVCAGFSFAIGNVTKNLPDVSQITGVKVLGSLGKEGNFYSSDYLLHYYRSRTGYTSKGTRDVLQQLTLISQDAIEMVHGQLTYEMESYLRSEESYENWYVYNLEVPVVFYQGEKEFVRLLHFSDKNCDKLMDHMAEEAANTHEYQLPMTDPNLNKDWYVYGTLYSLGWDFSEEQIQETYKRLREEYSKTKPPLIVFMGKEYNKENVFDFLEYVEFEGNEGALPISVDTPKTLEYVINTGNQIREDFDFDWFVKYMSEDIANRGGTLDIILYTGKEKGILYETFSWWGEYVYDMETDRLKELQSILATHNEEYISAEENLLCLVYKNIDGVETTGHWYNVTDEEAARIEELAWMQDKFQRYQYWQY